MRENIYDVKGRIESVTRRIKASDLKKILKVKPPDAYPPEDGRYMRGNDYSSVAVVILLHTVHEKIPDFLKELARVSVEAGAALAGFLQTENVGMEKIICNVVANPNIRHILLCGIESTGHHPGQTFEAFMKNGVDDKRTIVGAISQTPYLYNISLRAIERFRKQVKLTSLLIEDDRKLRIDPDTIREIINACIQEVPTQILNFKLYDPGAYPEPLIYQKITWRVERPWTHYSEEDAEKMKKIKEMATLRYKKEEKG